MVHLLATRKGRRNAEWAPWDEPPLIASERELTDITQYMDSCEPDDQPPIAAPGAVSLYSHLNHGEAGLQSNQSGVRKLSKADQYCSSLHVLAAVQHPQQMNPTRIMNCPTRRMSHGRSITRALRPKCRTSVSFPYEIDKSRANLTLFSSFRTVVQ